MSHYCLPKKITKRLTEKILGIDIEENMDNYCKLKLPPSSGPPSVPSSSEVPIPSPSPIPIESESSTPVAVPKK